MLTVVRANCRLAADELAKQDGSSERIRDRLARIRASAEYATELTEQLQTYSGKLPVRTRPLDLSELSRDLLDLLRASVSEKIQIEVDVSASLPPVEGDATQIRQVLHNLVTNASQALGDEGGLIQIRTRVDEVDAAALSEAFGSTEAKPGSYVALEVWDSGPGIPPEVLTRIFEPFFTTRKQGRGLGLAAVLGIVAAHGGVVTIASEPDEGTAFRILLPPAARTADRPANAAIATPAPSPRGTVLVVDDDAWVLEIAREFLVRAGFEVLTAHGGREGVETVRERGADIDVVVLDLVMPEVSGEEAFVEMRRLREDLPVVLASGYDRESTARRFANEGVAGVLYKPYEPEDIVASVSEALR